MANISQMSNPELTAWATNFITVVGASPADYGLTAGQIADFAAANNDLKTKMTEHIAADDAASAACAAENGSRKILEPISSYYNTTIKANTDITDTAKVAAGIEPRKPPTYTPPTTPTSLTANGYEDGTNVLKWNRAGNKPTTQFIIEYRESGETAFEYLATTTVTTYKHKNATPGMQCAYRVKAQRAGEESAYSNTAVVYMT